MTSLFTGKVVVVTGAGGLLGREHTKAIQQRGGVVVGVDTAEMKGPDLCVSADVTDPEVARWVLHEATEKYGEVYGLVNNAAHNPKVEDGLPPGTFETMNLTQWWADLDVGLTGAFLFCQTFAPHMAANGGGAIVNMGSVLSVIAPDQRLYDGGEKPVTYSVEKYGVIGLTRYVATYYAAKGVRCNALSPAGVFNNQPGAFVDRLTDRIPMGRMCWKEEIRKATVFLLTAGYMTGHNLVMDGGYSAW